MPKCRDAAKLSVFLLLALAACGVFEVDVGWGGDSEPPPSEESAADDGRPLAPATDVAGPPGQPTAGFFDCSPAGTLTRVGLSLAPQDPNDVQVWNDYAQVADSVGVRTIDVFDPSQPSEVGRTISSEAYEIESQGRYAYTMSGLGLWVVDMVVKGENMTLDYGGFYGPRDELEVSGSSAYVRRSDGVVLVVDLTVPTAPTVVGEYDPPGQIHGGEIRGNLIFSIRDRAAVTPLSSMFVSGDYLYVADLDAGLRVVDVSVASRPHEVAHVEVPVLVSDVAVIGDTAYLFTLPEDLGADLEFWRSDVSIPSSPSDPLPLGSVPFPVPFSVEGVCSFMAALYPFVAADPSSPGFPPIEIADLLRGVAEQGDHLFVTVRDEGLVILEWAAGAR